MLPRGCHSIREERSAAWCWPSSSAYTSCRYRLDLGCKYSLMVARFAAAGYVQSSLRLAGVAANPPVSGDGILPEVFFGGGTSFAGEVFPHNTEARFKPRPVIGVRPIASEDQVVFAENIPKLIQPGTIEVQVGGYPSIDAAQDLGNLHIDLRTFGEFAQVGFVLL